PPPTSSLSASRPFLPPPSPSPFAFPHHLDLLDLYLPTDPFFVPPLIPSPHAFLLHDLTDRVAVLELAARAAAPQPARRKYTYAATEPGGRKVKWTAEEKPRGRGRALKWEAELASPNDDGFDRKWRWEAKSKGGAGGKTKSKWGTEIKGKGSLEPWSHAYTWEEDFTASDDDEDELEVEERRPEKPKKIKAAAKDKEDDKKKKKPARTCIQIEEIPEENTAGCDAICKAFAMGNGKGKAKELSPQDAALLIQMNYRAHLTHRSQVLSCLRDLALAKAMLKELRSLFYNLSYRRRLLHDHEEHQRFSEKIIVLLLTVDALEVSSVTACLRLPIADC
ncbi:BAG family molecular chaperone regulator 7-like, partial [Triticum dicoccoides]|uniref:BAG family molecular chaperone regulator 7-like n=1 Tax=Triticum dicoccoides TaxID=85692 RepID=UPI00189117C5